MLTLLGFCVLLVLSAMVDAGIADTARLEKSSEKCRQGTPITTEWLTDLYSGRVMEEPEQAIKCYFSCILTELDMWAPDGMIKIDEKHGHFHDCAQRSMEHMSDRCDMAYHFNKCIHTQHPDLPVV